MPETETTTTETIDTNVDTTTEVDPPAPDDLGDSGKAAIVAEREARKAAEKRLKDLEKSLKEYEDRDKSELQREREAREAAEKRAEQAEFASLRNKVAGTKGVPASSLTGKTEEELNASADELIAWRDQHKTATPPPATKRPPSGSLKSGATGAENNNLDPKAAAADALRRMRAGT